MVDNNNSLKRLKRLKNIGFKLIGDWTLKDSNLVLKLNECEEMKNILYCFAFKDKPLYIGKTTQRIKQRLYGYKNPGQTQRTNVRVNKMILDFFDDTRDEGKRIQIYILPDHGLLKYGDFKISLAGGIEDSLIRGINPLWNLLQKKKFPEIDEIRKAILRSLTKEDYLTFAGVCELFDLTPTDAKNYLLSLKEIKYVKFLGNSDELKDNLVQITELGQEFVQISRTLLR